MNSNHMMHSNRTHIQNFALMMQIVASVLSISFTVLMCAIVYWQVEAQLTPMFKGVEYQRIIDWLALKLVLMTAALSAVAFIWRTVLSKRLLKDYVQSPFGILAERARGMARGELSEAPISEQQAMRQGMRVMLEVNELDDLFICIDSMSTYLQELTDKARSIAKGDLVVDVKPRSEEDLLSISFGTLVSRLRTVIGQVRERLAELRTAVTDLSSASDHQSRRIESQAAAMQQSMPVLGQLRETLGQASIRVNEMILLVPQTNDVARTGAKALSTAAQTSAALKEQIQNLENEIQLISTSIDRIVGVVAFVKEVVDRSRLLSVNAAIEAAKADSASGNLRTVALQISELSQKSRESAVEIENVMRDIQATARSAMAVTREGSQLCEQAISNLDLVRSRANDVMKSVVKSNSAGQVIAGVMEKQLHGTEEVFALTQTISGAAKGIVTTSRKQRQAAASLNTLAEQIAETVAIYRLND